MGHTLGTARRLVVSLLGWMMAVKRAALLLIATTGWKTRLDAMHHPSRERISHVPVCSVAVTVKVATAR